MKKVYLFIACTILGLGMLQAQDLKRAKTYFERAFYSDAIPLYEELVKSNRSKEVVQNLADSYYNTYQLPRAAKWYAYLTEVYGENLSEDYYFKYSQTLKSIGQYGEATEVLMEYYTQADQTAKVEKLKAALSYLENVDAIGERFTLKSLALNTERSEFGAAQVDSNLVYSAAKKKEFPLGNKIYRWNNQGYLDLYQHPVSNLDLGDSISTSFSKKVNTKMHEGTFAISRDGQTLYFTRNNFIHGKKRTDSKKISNLNIYIATLKDGEWTNIAALPFNGDDFSTEHPALSPDGKTLYFASDRTGGQGSFDLYSVTVFNNGTFGEPKNLGDKINTERKEQFPFVDKNDNLYFSSNGHAGFGLLDVFISKNNNGTFEKPDNLGFPVNGGYDDFSIAINTDGKTGYFSSNRPDGKGSDDIYAFTETQPLLIENCKQLIAGVITDKTTKMILSNASVSLLDADNKVVQTLITAADASFSFSVECASQYRIEAKKEAYLANFKTVQTDKERNATKDGSLTLYSIQERAKQAALVQQKKQEEAEKLTLLETEIKLKKEKIAAQEQIQAKKENEERNKVKQEKAKKERLQKIEETIQKEDAIVKEDERTIIKTDEIHFDYSLWYLRRESRERLVKVIEIMKSNPSMVIEIGTHTDIRGNDNYNKNLSQKRANSVKIFMVKNGIQGKRVIAKGYGESQPIVECKTEEDCTEEDHEWNRRCEFVIVKWE